jgi:hypothetical protein
MKMIFAEGFLSHRYRLIKSTKTNEGNCHTCERSGEMWVDWAQANGTFKTPECFFKLPG